MNVLKIEWKKGLTLLNLFLAIGVLMLTATPNFAQANESDLSLEVTQDLESYSDQEIILSAEMDEESEPVDEDETEDESDSE